MSTLSALLALGTACVAVSGFVIGWLGRGVYSQYKLRSGR